MKNNYLTLAARIEKEIKDIENVVVRALEVWNHTDDSESGKKRRIDSAALNLHAFYSGIERIFELIAKNIDDFQPSGLSWHRELLKQMSIELSAVRPAVISEQLREDLNDYLGFRHLIRNIYTFQLREERVEPLIKNLKSTFNPSLALIFSNSR